MGDTKLIVIGGLNTDIVASGVSRFPKPGEHVYGKQLQIGPGGKSRNIAAMAGLLSPEDAVVMIGRTAKDTFGLWKLPIDALHQAGVSTDYVTVLEHSETDKLPAVALIAVNAKGENQIVVLPGVSEDFSTSDIEAAEPAFLSVQHNRGIVAVTLECPLPTAKHAIKKAVDMNIRVVFDPGGIESTTDVASLLKLGIFLVKPNEHEAKLMTGVKVVDFATAKTAADKLKKMGATNVFITHGEHGAYLFTDKTERHLPIPELKNMGDVRDSTGCGDQAMAALCAILLQGGSLEEAARAAVGAGTLQFYRAGIQPLTRADNKS